MIISIYAEHTTRSGELIRDCDYCESDDHLHLEFDDLEDAEGYADRMEKTGRFGRVAAASIREELDFLK